MVPRTTTNHLGGRGEEEGGEKILSAQQADVISMVCGWLVKARVKKGNVEFFFLVVVKIKARTR